MMYVYRTNPHIGMNTAITTMMDGTILTNAKFIKKVQTLYYEVTGCDHKDVGTHSFRSGGYQDAKAEGHPDGLILAQAYWKSMKSAVPYEERMKTYDSIDAEKMKHLNIE